MKLIWPPLEALREPRARGQFRPKLSSRSWPVSSKLSPGSWSTCSLGETFGSFFFFFFLFLFVSLLFCSFLHFSYLVFSFFFFSFLFFSFLFFSFLFFSSLCFFLCVFSLNSIYYALIRAALWSRCSAKTRPQKRKKNIEMRKWHIAF